MSEALTPTNVHEALDVNGWLDDAHGAGCYALRLAVPSSVEEATRRWLHHFDSTPGEDAVERMATAPAVAYVGASTNVYDRLMDHAEGEKRKAAALRAFHPVEVVGVYPSPEPFEAEWNTAHSLAAEGYLVWCNGELVDG